MTTVIIWAAGRTASPERSPHATPEPRWAWRCPAAWPGSAQRRHGLSGAGTPRPQAARVASGTEPCGPTCAEVREGGQGLHAGVEPAQGFAQALRLRLPAGPAVVRVTRLVTQTAALHRIKANVHLSGRREGEDFPMLKCQYPLPQQIAAVHSLQGPSWMSPPPSQQSTFVTGRSRQMCGCMTAGTAVLSQGGRQPRATSHGGTCRAGGVTRGLLEEDPAA